MIGVFICKCGVNIAGTVDVDRIAEVVRERGCYAEVLDYACSKSGQETIAERIKEKNLKALVIAACSPKLHEHTFRKLAEKSGVNPYKVVMANIREQCTWVHNKSPETQKKAEELTLMAVERVKHSRELKKRKVNAVRKVLIIGGGIAGIETALLLANSGVEVILVEKQPSLGGHMALLNEIFPNNDCSICVLAPKMSEVWEHEKIKVYTCSEVEEIEGYTGNFKVKIRVNPRYVNEECKGCIEDCTSVCPITVYDEFLGCFRKAIYVPFPQSVPLYARIDSENCIKCDMCVKACEPNAIDFSQKPKTLEVNVGAIVVATGYTLFNPEISDKGVITLLELERLISSKNFSGKKVAFVLCVGSRDLNTNKHCSAVCCMASIKNAMILKNKGAEVTVFYTDIRAPGSYENYYRKAMESGVKFVRAKPVVENGVVRYEDTLLGRVFEEEFDLVVLATGMNDNFVEVIHPKLRPVETLRAGVFVAGCASGPKDIRDSIYSAGLAASKVLEFLECAEKEPYSAFVEGECNACRTCEKLCPAEAIEVLDRAKVISEACRMCGLCVSACPANAMNQGFYSNEELFAEISAVPEGRIIVFACNYCAYSALDLAGAMRMKYSELIRVIRVPCSVRVSAKMILEALKKSRGVVLAGCRIGECHFGVNEFAKRRFDALAKALDTNRLKSVWCSAGEAEKIVRELEEFVKTVVV